METMKKPYMRPEEEVVELKMEQSLLAGSGESGTGEVIYDAPKMGDDINF